MPPDPVWAGNWICLNSRGLFTARLVLAIIRWTGRQEVWRSARLPRQHSNLQLFGQQPNLLPLIYSRPTRAVCPMGRPGPWLLSTLFDRATAQSLVN